MTPRGGEDNDDTFEEEKSSKDSPVVPVSNKDTSTQTQTQLTAMSDMFKDHVDKAMGELKDQHRIDFETMLGVLQQESTKRTALEQRLHSQLLLQNEFMVAMELKLLRLEAKVERREASIRQQHLLEQQQQQQQRNNNNAAPYINYHRSASAFQTIDESSDDNNNNIHHHANNSTPGSVTTGRPGVAETPPNMAVISSSGASLASGVTAGSFLGDDGDDDDSKAVVGDDDEEDNDSGTRADDTIATDSGEPITREMDCNAAWSQHSTPTQGSRPRVAVGGENGTLESILLNPMLGEAPNLPWSVRATRGQDTDGNSSLATSVTNSTYTSTVVTSTTRADGSMVNVRRILPEESEMELTPSRRGRSSAAALVEEVNTTRGVGEESRGNGNESPLTVHSHGSENLSLASASTVGTSIRSSVAVAPRSGFGRRTLSANSSALTGSIIPTTSDSRPLANRVVSFTNEPAANMISETESYNDAEAGDSITLPDEIDNFSEVADTFANTARAWREDYEARLDALQKKWSNE